MQAPDPSVNDPSKKLGKSFALIAWLLVMALVYLFFATQAIMLSKPSDNPLLSPMLFKYLPWAILLGLLIYLAYHFFQLNSRPSKINLFITELENKQTINHLNEHTRYRLYIRLPRIIKLKLLPINYGIIQFDNKKVFQIPMPSHCVQPIHNFASGATHTSIDDAWSQLDKN